MLCLFIVHIIYLPDQTPFEELPAVRMVTFPSYRGPTLYTDNNIPIVPIVPTVVRWEGQRWETVSKRRAISHSCRNRTSAIFSGNVEQSDFQIGLIFSFDMSARDRPSLGYSIRQIPLRIAYAVTGDDTQ